MSTALGWNARRLAASEALPPAQRDAARVRAAQRGDRLAMDALVRAHQNQVYGFLYRLTNNRDLALDLSQETFLKAFKALGGFRPEAPMSPWLLAIARNCFLDQTRLRRHDPLEDGDAGAEDPALLRLSADTGIMDALQHVPSPLREALVLRHVEDLTYDEIAVVLGSPLGTVKTWIHRGRANLRQLMEKGGGQ